MMSKYTHCLSLSLSLSLSHVADIWYNFPYIIVLVDRFEIRVHLNECMDKSSTTFLFVSLNGLNLIHMFLFLTFCMIFFFYEHFEVEQNRDRD